MVLRNPRYPRLPRKYWGQLIYATPGCGKTFVSRKYRDVVDGDDMIVEAIRQINPNFYFDENYDDPRFVIYQYFRYIRFSRSSMWRVYNLALRKMRAACYDDDVVLFGTLDLIDQADRVFVQESDHHIRDGFNKSRENAEVEDLIDVPVHYIYQYLDNSLQRAGVNRQTS